jgi:hypothetical protein
MLKKITTSISTLIIVCSFSAAVLPNVAAAAALKSDACAGLSQVDASQSCGSNSGGTVSNLLKTTINLLSLIVGFAAVVVLILSGLRFITAQGDASSVANARNGVIYAMVGLTVAALAQVIVHFVLGKV